MSQLLSLVSDQRVVGSQVITKFLVMIEPPSRDARHDEEI